jgi:uncharacterized membrane protein
MTNFLGFLLPGLLMFAVKPSAIKNIPYVLSGARIRYISVNIVNYSIAAISIGLAYSNGGQASQIGPMSQISIVLSVTWAAIFLQEKTKLLQKFLASIIIIIGVILLN